MSATSETIRRLTVVDIAKLYADGQRIPMLTAYDFPTAKLLDEAGIPLLLVGDSLGQVILGYETTVRVTMPEMVHHTKAVVRGTQHALVVADMPFLSYSTPEDALDNAGVFLREAGAQAVKVEGGVRTARTIETLVRAGIPVMGHIGLTPQAINTFGKVRVQGKTRDQARSLVADALAVQEAGAFAMVLELVPEQLAAAITRAAAGPDHRHRSRCRLQRSGPGLHGPDRAGRLRPASRPPVRARSRDDPRGCGRLRGGRDRRHVPGRGRVGPHGRRGPRRGPRSWRVRSPGRLDPRRGHPARPRPLNTAA